MEVRAIYDLPDYKLVCSLDYHRPFAHRFGFVQLPSVGGEQKALLQWLANRSMSF